MQRRVHYSLERPAQRQVRWGGQRGRRGELRGRRGGWRGACGWRCVRGSVFRLRFRHIRGAGGVVRVCRGGGARGGGDGSLGLQLPPQPVRQCCCRMEARGHPHGYLDCRGRALGGGLPRSSAGCGAEANWFADHLGKISGQRGWGDEWRGGRGGWQARYGADGGNPDAHTPSATGGELRQSRLVLGLLHLGEHVPALAWGMVRGSARERGRGREGQDLGSSMGLGTGGRGRGGSGRAMARARARTETTGARA